MNDVLVSKNQGVVGRDPCVLEDQSVSRRTSNGERVLSKLEGVDHHPFVDDLQFHVMNVTMPAPVTDRGSVGIAEA